MPQPTRAAYHSTEKRRAREATNRARLSATRQHFGHVFLRLVPQVRVAPERPNQYGALLGQAFTVHVDEAVDVEDAARAYLDARGLRLLAVLDEVAASRHTTVAAVSLAWLLAQPTVAAPIASARTTEQLAELLPVATLTLTEAEVTRLGAA